MSIQHCESFLLQTLTGTHDFSTDTIKLALFDGNATFDSDTTAYSTTNETVTGGGYTTGGVTLALTSGYPQIENSSGAVRFSAATWTFTAERSVRWALMYNSSKSNKAILSIDLGAERAFIGAFTINFPLTTDPIICQRASMS